MRDFLCEQNARLDTLHPDRVLFILVKVAKDLEKVLLWHLRNKFDHVIEYERGTLSNLRKFILGCLGE